jgi:hypothetical protein
VIPRLGRCEKIGERQKYARAVILSEAKNLALSSFAISQFHRQSEIPSLRSGQALRGVYPERQSEILRAAQNDKRRAEDDTEGLRLTGIDSFTPSGAVGHILAPLMRLGVR